MYDYREQGQKLAGSMESTKLFKLFDDFIDIAKGEKKGDLAGAIEKAVKALQGVEARKISMQNVQDILVYLKYNAPKRLQGEAQTQLEALRKEMTDLAKEMENSRK